MLKKGLMLILFVILCKTRVFAGISNDIRGVFIYEDARSDDDTRGESFFLFTRYLFQKSHSGKLYLLKSDVVVRGNFEGEIYAFFSDVTIDGELTGHVYTVSSTVRVAEDRYVPGSIGTFNVTTGLDVRYANCSPMQPGYVVFDDQIPDWLIRVILFSLRLLFFLSIFPIRKAFFEQGSMTMLKKPIRVLLDGLVVYFFFIAICVIFLVSVVGFPVAVLFFLVFVSALFVGEISLSMMLGYLITDRLHVKTFSYANMVLGAIILEIIRQVPYLNVAIRFFSLPILCAGILCRSIIDGSIRRIFYELPYRVRPERAGSGADIRNRVLDGIGDMKE